MCPLLPQKRKMAEGGACAKKERKKKNIPGSSLIEAPDVAGVHHDKKRVEEVSFIREGRRRKEGIRSSGEEELVDGGG